MSKLPVISGRKCVQALKRADFYQKRQTGSHLVLRRDEPFTQVVVPDHKVLGRGTLRAIIRQAGLGVDEFLHLLELVGYPKASRAGDEMVQAIAKDPDLSRYIL